jgi:hypothetical protein
MHRAQRSGWPRGLPSLQPLSQLSNTPAPGIFCLGLSAMFSSAKTFQDVEIQPAAVGQIFRDAFFVALLNPKTVIFFAAFLPQFIGEQSAP